MQIHGRTFTPLLPPPLLSGRFEAEADKVIKCNCASLHRRESGMQNTVNAAVILLLGFSHRAPTLHICVGRSGGPHTYSHAFISGSFSMQRKNAQFSKSLSSLR